MGTQAKIGGKIVLEGEKEYREALKGIAGEQKELRSEMKLCNSMNKESQNSLHSLKDKYEILTKQIDVQGERVKVCSKAVEDYTKKQEDSKKKVSDLSEEYEKASKELTEMSSASKVSKETLDAQQKKVEELGKKLSVAQSEYDKSTQATQKWQTSLNYAETEMVELQGELQKTEKYLEEAENATDGCATSIDGFGKSTKEAANNAENMGSKGTEAINALAGALVTTGIAKGVEEIAEALVDCSEKSKEFETTIAKVSTVADNTVLSMGDMKKAVLEVSSDLGIAAGNISEATYNAISASVDTASAVQFAGDATKLAIGGFTDSTTAVDILTTSVNAYKLEIEDVTKVSDMLVTTQNLGKTTVGELASNMGKVIPLAASYNVEMNNLSTTYAILTANGIKTAESTTYIKAMLGELGKSSSAVSKALVEETGKSFGTLMSTGSSLGDVIQILGKHVDNDSAKFNALWSSSDAGIGALSLLGAGGEKFNEVLEEMNNSARATDEAFNKMAETTEMAENKFRTSIDNLKIAVGDELNPSLEELYEVGTNAFSWATDFVNENPEVVSAITAVVAGAGVLVIGVSALTVAVIALNAASEVLNNTLKANPWIMIGSAIAAVTVALGTLIVMTGDAKSETEKLLEVSKKEIATLKESVQTRKEAGEAFIENSDELQRLKERVVELNEKENLNTEQKADMLAAVHKLNEAMPELNLQIDTNTGKVQGNTNEIEANIEARLQSYDLKFMEEELAEIAKERYEAEKQLAELTEDRADKQAELSEKEAELAEWLETNKENIQDYSSAYAAAMQNSETGNLALENSVASAKEELGRFDEQMAETRELIATSTEDFENVSTAIDGSKTSMEEAGNASIEYKNKIYEVAPGVAENIKTIEESFTEAKNAAHDSIMQQVGLFDELSVKSDLTAEKMTSNLNSQTETYNQYSSDLRKATELMEADTSGNFEKMLNSIMGMGVNGSGYLRELVSTAETSSGEFAEIVASFGAMEEARTTLEETMADLNTGYSTQMEELLEITKTNYEEMELATSGTYENIKAEIEKAMEEMKEKSDKGIVNMAAGVTKNSKEVVKAAELMCTDVKSGMDTKMELQEGVYMVFHRVGNMIDASVAKGITDGQKAIATALQNAVNEAVNLLDFSKIQSKVTSGINRALGSAF